MKPIPMEHQRLLLPRQQHLDKLEDRGLKVDDRIKII